MALHSPLFTKINETFICNQCYFNVPLAEKTCRDHCPKCLYSKHVDINPGDRASTCLGILKPVAWSQNKKKGYMIHYICEKCQETRVNKFLAHDANYPDEFSALLELSSITKDNM